MKIETIEIAGFCSAIKGMRNPLNSWAKSDSNYWKNEFGEDVFVIGENDLDLAKRLIKGGSEHCKFLRQIQVWVDMDMPRYIWQEFDTYHYNSKNSCSTMHTIMKHPITFDDFFLGNDIENMLKKNNITSNYFYKCDLPKGEKEYFTDIQGYEGLYQISNRGEIIRNETSFEDINGRIRVFPMKLVKPSPTKAGYLELNLRKDKISTKFLHHRLMAEHFIPNPDNKPYVNHKDGNKQNNSVDNLEWVTSSENNKHAFDNKLKTVSEYAKTIAKINNYKFGSKDIRNIKQLHKQGLTQIEIAQKFECSQSVISEVLLDKTYEDIDLIEDIRCFQQIIDRINELRIKYLETKDYSYVIRIKRLLPEGFLQLRTVNTNYAELRNIYHQRKHHRLHDEWVETFCKWVESLPYSKELIIGYDE